MKEEIVLRFEFNGAGPFWDYKIFKKIKSICRKITPEVKQYINEPETFLDFYIENNMCPEEFIQYDQLLEKFPNKYKFAFNNYESVHTAFGLENSVFMKQFNHLLTNGGEVLHIIADVVVEAEYECLIVAKSIIVVETS